MNTISLIGRLGRDPELKTLDSGTKVANFSIAVKRRFKDKNGEYPTDWFNIVAFGKTGEFAKNYFHKGDPIGVVGSIQTRVWEADDGTKKYFTEVIAEQLHFTGSKRESDVWEQPETTVDTESLPFDM